MSTRTVRRASPKSPAVMKHADHSRLWRMVEGAVVSAFQDHPDYLTETGQRNAVQSITKRVVGNLVGHAHELRKQASLGMRSPPSVYQADELLVGAGGSEAGATPPTSGGGCPGPRHDPHTEGRMR